MQGKFQGRGYTERVNVIHGSALNTGGNSTTFSKEFPMGEGWYAMYINIAIALTVGTGTGAISEGELQFIKNIQLKTDRGEVICDLPGRALYKIATFKYGSPPDKDAIAASSATYNVNLPIQFADWKMSRMQDTILDTSRYNSVTLQITLGTVSDLLTTPGTATVTATCDVELQRSMGPLPASAKPHYHINYAYRPPVDASVLTTIDLERSADMSIKRLYVHSGTSGTAGVPFSGTNSDAVQSQSKVQDQNRVIEKDRVHRMIQQENKNECLLESRVTGIEMFDFVHEGSISGALATGAKSVLQYIWTNQGGVAANSIVTVAHEAIRSLK